MTTRHECVRREMELRGKLPRPKRDFACWLCHKRGPRSTPGPLSVLIFSDCVALPCGHLFHYKCLQEKLWHRFACPCCDADPSQPPLLGWAHVAGTKAPETPPTPRTPDNWWEGFSGWDDADAVGPSCRKEPDTCFARPCKVAWRRRRLA
jgi:hypothetical protein